MRSRGRLLWHEMRVLIASILVGTLSASSVAADEPAEAETAAQVHLDRGIAAYGAGEFALAQKELAIAVELVPHKPNPYRWLALAEIQLGNCAHARLDVDSFIARVAAEDPRIPELVRARDSCKQKGIPKVLERPAPIVVVEDPPREEKPALVTRWWFWTTIGLSAAMVATAFVFATQSDDATVLPQVRCDASGCR
jgi:hypothetical protein